MSRRHRLGPLLLRPGSMSGRKPTDPTKRRPVSVIAHDEPPTQHPNEVIGAHPAFGLPRNRCLNDGQLSPPTALVTDNSPPSLSLSRHKPGASTARHWLTLTLTVASPHCNPPCLSVKVTLTLVLRPRRDAGS